MENGKRVNGYYLVILILSLIIMTIGITFAYFTLVGKEENDSTQIWTGTLSINYVDGKEIKAYDLFPINEPKLGDTTYVYTKNFSVSSSICRTICGTESNFITTNTIRVGALTAQRVMREITAR